MLRLVEIAWLWLGLIAVVGKRLILPNTSPTDLNSTAPLTFAENLPIGTIIGEFNATDPGINATLTYSLVSGTGDGNNSLFTMKQTVHCDRHHF